MYDFVIKNGLIVDCSRKKPFTGNLYAKYGKIAKVIKAKENAALEDAKEINRK